MNLILASASPRRQELMRHLGVCFTIIPAVGPERAPAGLGPGETAAALAAAKALEVSRDRPEAVVIGADTLVEIDGDILGKPRNAADATRMLRRLSGRAHSVYTGVTVVRSSIRLTQCERTKVFFRPLTDREIDIYVATGEPMDKAGAYGYQGLASLFVERIEGDAFNVVGLPLCRLGRMLAEVGVVLL